MGLPRLRAALSDAREVARVLRGALRHEVEVVPLEAPPEVAGQHLLEIDIDIPDAAPVVLLADPMGEPTDEGVPFRVRPITREQMATLLHLVERLDEEPSNTMPPPDDGGRFGEAPADDDSDDTLVETMSIGDPYGSSRPPAFGIIESLVPESVAAGTGKSSFPEHALVGRVIAGKYRIDSVIGSGASAAVFRALHLGLERPVAIKVLHDENRAHTQFVKRFKAEALAASKLEHPNVARVLDFGVDADGLPYIVMELLAGRTLEAILAAEGRLPPALVGKIAVQTCLALAVAHDAGIIHRDIKPENLMLVPGKDDDGNTFDVVKVCDFGLAKLRDVDPEHADLTTHGMLCGSPAYMSPEQTRGEPLDARTDVYSLGVAMFEALTGRLPHDGATIGELFLEKVMKPALPPSRIAPGVDPALDHVVTKALASDRSQRYATARAFRDDVKKVLERLR